ncbi:MAG: SMC family ATPase [Nocardioidaceae bacterium]
MRLHQLTVTAFGPFAGTETVDFEELNDAGLFLLTGPTGAGKSSLLDAVSFALYGSVPGARGVKTLKSQHAPVDRSPQVVLDFTVRDRRFVVRRSPEWSRPKRRGDGLVTEKAQASILEVTGGVEHFRSARAAEVGLLVTELMGMNAAQFSQVALLPQGEFQTFLRATSQERHGVLQHLFRTDRFARIEEWVHEHSRDLRQQSGQDRSTVQRLLDSVADRMAVPPPEDLTGDVLAWAEEQVARAAAVLDDEDHRHHAAEAELRQAVALHDAAVLRGEQAARRTAAEAVLRDLEATADDDEEARRHLDAASRAAVCAPLLGVLDQAVGAATRAGHERDRTLSRLGPGTAPLDAAGLTDHGRTLRTRATRLEALLPRETAGRTATRDLESARTRLAAAEDEIATSARRADELPGEIVELTGRHATLDALAGRHEALVLSLTAARGRAQAAADLVLAHADVTRLADRHRDARDRSLTAREDLQQVVSRRLAEMAAELAGGLADGEPCQVCGSTSHPEPAAAAHDAVGADDQEAAEVRVATTGAALETAGVALRDAEHRRDTCDADAAGLSSEEADAEVTALALALADAESAVTERRLVVDRLDHARTELTGLTGRRAEAATVTAGLRQAMAAQAETVRTVQAELAAAGASDRGVRPAADELAGLADLVEQAATVVDAAERSEVRVAELRDQCATSAAEQGFASVDEARAARLLPTEVRRLQELTGDRARSAGRAQDVLAELGDATVSPDGDTRRHPDVLPGLAHARAQAVEVTAASARRLHLAEDRSTALAGTLTRLREAVVAWTPLRDRSDRAEAMSALVRGMGHDNQLQMRLSAYVLATRLDQVVAAANERLGHMRDQRYLLQRTDRAARKGSQAGLGLEVVDQWTGDARDPVTLSGGETFVVSLSLALGLADVVTQEAGGTEIDTLFVDEGFGTLDADTLDDVMDRLDGLRAGGRTVGVVSHVSELRNRIPTQVHVAKGRSGSSLSVTTLVG